VEWAGLAQILSKLRPVGYRVVEPIQALDNRWVIDGWMATRLIEGVSGYAGRETEALSACRCFHQDLSKVYTSTDCPDWLGNKPTIYRKADKLTWCEEPYPRKFNDDIAKILQPISEARSPIDLPNQITHGDPGGENVLFAENLAPAMIDIAPYWRPAGYAIAMMLADGIAWEGSNPSTLSLVEDEPFIGQLLLRAVLFRLTLSVLCCGSTSLARRYAAYAPVTMWALSHR